VAIRAKSSGWSGSLVGATRMSDAIIPTSAPDASRPDAHPSPNVEGRFSDPLFILAPARSFTSVVSAMLGQHPQMYGLPEIHLFNAETLAELWGFYSQWRQHGRAGLLRAVAQLYSGEQTVQTIMLAQHWVKRRLSCDTGSVFKELVEKANGAILVDKSPETAERIEALCRLQRTFPNARFIHLLRHPLAVGRSILETFGELVLSRRDSFDYGTNPPTLDPQKWWYRVHLNILLFLKSVPQERQLCIRGEDLLSDPDHHLEKIAGWLGLRTDSAAIEEMKHPERSPFACFGPPNARFGADPHFLAKPALRKPKASNPRLEAPLPWRSDGRGFSPEVKELARQFGYK
jgi:Sulfotransferase family